jgi:hypothetical protein
MIILAAYKAVLLATPMVTNIAEDRFYIGRVGQDVKRPNVLLKSDEQGQDYTHSGPVGVFDAHVRIIARADTDQGAFLLGDAIARALQDYTGTSQGCRIQMTEHFNSASGYDDAGEVFTQTEEFTSFFTRTS